MELGIRGGQTATLSREEQASRIWTMGEKSELGWTWGLRPLCPCCCLLGSPLN